MNFYIDFGCGNIIFHKHKKQPAKYQHMSIFHLNLSIRNFLLCRNHCSANQWTGFYVEGTSVVKELMP